MDIAKYKSTGSLDLKGVLMHIFFFNMIICFREKIALIRCKGIPISFTTEG